MIERDDIVSAFGVGDVLQALLRIGHHDFDADAGEVFEQARQGFQFVFLIPGLRGVEGLNGHIFSLRGRAGQQRQHHEAEREIADFHTCVSPIDRKFSSVRVKRLETFRARISAITQESQMKAAKFVKNTTPLKC